MSDEDNKWSQPSSPPSPMFLGKKERDLTKQINDELIERVIGQTLIYFPLNVRNTNFHPLYGEAIEKTYSRPIVIKALVKWDGEETYTSTYGIDKSNNVTVNFHRRRLTQDQELFVREGDVIFYGIRFFEIMKLKEPRLLFGQADQKFEIQAICKGVRQGFFNEPLAILQLREQQRLTQASLEQVIIDTPIDGVCEGRIQLISGKSTSPQRSQFLDYFNNPQNYPGCVIYLTELDNDQIIGVFNKANKFYFNEDGTWFESTFFGQ
jgi:hypothetical protein